MKDASFRDILRQFLEEKTQDSPPAAESKTTFSTTQHDFHWQAPESVGMRNSAYPKPPPRQKPPQAKVKQPEKKADPTWTLASFSFEELDALSEMKDMGAVEFTGLQTISRSVLKRAHRRLAKALHPDTWPANLSHKERTRKEEQFLRLQGAYEIVNAKLNQLASESACGNESASAAGSQRPDAA